MQSLFIQKNPNLPLRVLEDFYKSFSYSSSISLEDQFYVAHQTSAIFGVVRIAREVGTQVLRGMFIAEQAQRQGVGTKLLQMLHKDLNHFGEDCFCIPYSHLVSFYGQIGFEAIQDLTSVPAFLKERLNRYRSQGKDVLIMKWSAPSVEPPGVAG